MRGISRRLVLPCAYTCSPGHANRGNYLSKAKVASWLYSVQIVAIFKIACIVQIGHIIDRAISMSQWESYRLLFCEKPNSGTSHLRLFFL